MKATGSERELPIEQVNEDEDGPGESADQAVLDELGIEPSPVIMNESDVSIDGATLPVDLPGQASSTAEDLSALFDSTSARHLADGFIGSGDEDGANISQNDGDDLPDSPELPAGA